MQISKKYRKKELFFYVYDSSCISSITNKCIYEIIESNLRNSTKDDWTVKEEDITNIVIFQQNDIVIFIGNESSVATNDGYTSLLVDQLEITIYNFGKEINYFVDNVSLLPLEDHMAKLVNYLMLIRIFILQLNVSQKIHCVEAQFTFINLNKDQVYICKN